MLGYYQPSLRDEFNATDYGSGRTTRIRWNPSAATGLRCQNIHVNPLFFLEDERHQVRTMAHELGRLIALQCVIYLKKSGDKAWKVFDKGVRINDSPQVM